jgi:hypothetical protein
MGRDSRKYLELLPVPAAAAGGHAAGPYRPFPVETLPDPLAGFVREGARALGCDAAYLALPALAVAAAAIGTTRLLRLRSGLEVPCVVWSAVVGECRATALAAYRKAVWPLVRLQRDRLAQFRRDDEQYRREARAYEIALRRALRLFEEAPAGRPERPVLTRPVCCDTSVSALAEILEDSPRGTLVVREELDGWLLSLARPSGQHGSRHRAAWLALHRAGTLFVDRGVTGRHHLAPRAAASITGFVRPRTLARVLPPDGPADLLLLAMPPHAPAPLEAAADPENNQAYHALLFRLLMVGFDPGVYPEWLPHVLRLAPQALAGGEPGREDGGGGPAAAPFGAEGYAPRLVLIHHVVTRAGRRESDQVPVGRESVEAGAELGRWFADEARRIYAAVSGPAEESETSSLVGLIRARGGRMTVRELMRAHDHRYRSAAAAGASLDKLVDLGVGRWVAGGQASRNPDGEAENEPASTGG